MLAGMVGLCMVVAAVCQASLLLAASEWLMSSTEPWLVLGVFASAMTVWGFLASIVARLWALPLALWECRGKVLREPDNEIQRYLLDQLGSLAAQAKLRPPQLAIFPGDPNVFTVARSRNHALIGFSQGLLDTLGRRELSALLAREVVHIAQGRASGMVSVMGVVQGFVVWPALWVDALARLGRRKALPASSAAYFWAHLVLFYGLLGPVAGALVGAYTRRCVRQSDRAAASAPYKSSHLTSAFNRLATLRLSGRPGMLAGFYLIGERKRFPFFRHQPDLTQRLKAL